jgi:prepilin-type N-terminal cleavage/methylation domain-containing protein
MNERGFSLAEVMIAMVILTVGVLGLAASSAAITKMSSEGGRSGGSAAVAESRIEALSATPCANIASSGSATTGKFTESWTVTTASLLKTVTVTVSYPSGRATRTSTYVAYISCAPKA